MHASSQPPMFLAEATDALLSALTKSAAAAPAGTLTKDEKFALAVLTFLTARTLVSAERSEHASAV